MSIPEHTWITWWKMHITTEASFGDAVSRNVDLLDFLFRPDLVWNMKPRGCILLKMDLDLCIHHLLSLYKSLLKFPSNVAIQPSKTTSNHSSQNDPVPGSPGVVPLVRGAGKPAVFNVIVDIVIDWLYSLLLKQLDLPWLISILVRILILHTLQSFQHLFN